MIFNSITFFVFFLIFFGLYWLLLNKKNTTQNLLILLGSYVFYGWSDWRFLFLLVGVSVLNYYLGIKISTATSSRWKKIYLNIGLIQGIAGLAYFKYFNFFITSFQQSFAAFGINLNLHTLNIIVPLGISFFTFRTISYLLDVEKGKIKVCTDALIFFNYVSFFPSLLSGPIDKAKLLIPQLETKRVFNYELAKDGMRQILWGIFKKVVIANNCATVTDEIFKNYEHLPASTLVLGAFYYAIQIYADFSGYSDMAIGIAKLLGFNITKNFDFPFFAQNIADFWRRWHMSLTSWLTEYVFTPLSIKFRDYDKLGLALAIVINFTICGIWHGANWTYVLFGFLHGCYFIPLIINGTMNKKKKKSESMLPSFKELINMILTFTLVMFTFIIFRAASIAEAFGFYKRIFSKSLLSVPVSIHLNVLALVFLFLIIEWCGKANDYTIEKLFFVKSTPVKWAFYGLLTVLVYCYSFTDGNEQFIYFQF